jgi:tetratricopeptide (TPR) repeat protein
MEKIYRQDENRIYCNCRENCPHTYSIEQLAKRLVYKKQTIECQEFPYLNVNIEEMLKTSEDFNFKLALKMDTLHSFLIMVIYGLPKEQTEYVKVTTDTLYNLAIAYRESFYYTEAIKIYDWAISFDDNLDTTVELRKEWRLEKQSCIDEQVKMKGLEDFLTQYRWQIIKESRYSYSLPSSTIRQDYVF